MGWSEAGAKDHVMSMFEEVTNADSVIMLQAPFRFSQAYVFIFITTVTLFSVKILTKLTMNTMY